MFANIYAASGAPQTSTGEFISEFNKAGLFEGVDIIEPPREIQSGVTYLNCLQLFCGQNCRLSVACSDFVIRPQGNSSLTPIKRIYREMWRRGEGADIESNNTNHIIGWGLASVANPNFALGHLTYFNIYYPSFPDSNVSPQLAFGGFFSALNETPSAPPKGNGGAEKQEGKDNQKRVSNFQTSVEYRPKFGSLIAAMACIAVAFAACWRGMIAWENGRSLHGWGWIGCGLLLVFDGTIGLLFGWDLWSLWRLIL